MIRKNLIYLLFISILTFSCKGKKEETTYSSREAREDQSILHQYNHKNKEIKDPKATEIWDPEPEAVSFNENNVPSDAIVLFDGSGLDAWTSAQDTTAAKWEVKDGVMTVVAGTGDIKTRQKFGSVQLHLEWSAPDVVESEGQGRGNSGVFFQERYEVQILDSYQNRTYANGQAASVYKQHMPLVNATKAPDQWQTYDIIFHAPAFGADGKKTRSGTLTVFHNGVLVQDHVTVKGTTEYIGYPKNEAHGKGSIKLQDHGNPMQFRNIWVREL